MKTVFILVLMLLVFSSFVYSKSDYRDPFKSSLPHKIENMEGVVDIQEAAYDESEDILPDMVVQGILLHGNFPQVIIDGEVYKTGDRLKDVTAQIFKIEKGVVFISYGEKIYRIKIEKKNLVLDALLIERLKDHVAGPVRGVAGPSHERFSEIPGVPAEPSLIDASVGCTVEGQSPVLEIVHGLHCLFRKDERRVLIHEIVPAFDRVEGMPFGFVLFHVAQRGADPSLGRARVTPDGINF